LAVAKFAHDVVPLFDNGTIKPNVDRIFPLKQVREAYQYLASNQSFGKVVLELA